MERSPLLDYLIKNRLLLAMVAGGIVLVGSAIGVAQSNNLMETLVLDFGGERAKADVERLDRDRYRLRFAREAEIFARLYSGPIRGAPKDESKFVIDIAYDPSNPVHFLPAGLSYLPALVTGLLFVSGLGLVLSARRMARAAQRIQFNQFGRSPKHRRRHHHHHHHHRKHHHRHA